MSEPLGAGWATKKPPPGGDSEPPPKPRRFWWRFVLASVVIMAVSAAATSISILNFFDSIAAEISPENKRVRTQLEKVLAEAEGGEPQNFLLVGSDKRAGAEFSEDKGRSDTTILIRIDPDKELISMLSIPRDLKVEIPTGEGGTFTGKFNEAYFYGGTKGTAEVVKNLTGLPINHVININFLGFAQAVYAIGCVYTDVDRRYYHSNEGVPPSEQYAEIDVQPGYQLMCGKQALDYVRYRHTDTDIVRSARQQDFLSFARQRISPQDLVFDQDELIEVFTEYTTSDISEGREIIDVLKLVLAARNATINDVHFPAELGPSYVYASQSAINEAVNEFLGVSGSGGEAANREDAEARHQEESSGKKQGKKNKKKQKNKSKKKKEKPVVQTPPAGSDDLVPAREAGEMEAEIAARRVHGRFPIFYPTRLPAGAFYVETNPYEKVVDPYVYRIADGLGKEADRYEAYRMVLVAEMSDGTHYFGLQGIRGWPDPPILEDPTETKEINGREYKIFADGGRIKLIAWHRGENSYWVSNDLLESLSNDQMVGMARSAAVIVSKAKPKKGGNKG